ncbi:ABC transporter substrate-binding protein [Georgenia faecalis]|uniref:ABC transporter substrate-binding protein n=1 Tax=Georgenia faecalis TaxID=2483799 RepID=A0ABV9DA91_9MICO|nr:ABC transporter substrate-binding protein [Georgenia faecalis]
MRGSPILPAVSGLAALLVLAACGAGGGAGVGADPQPGDGPLTVTNCGAEVTFDRPPERVVLLSSAAVPFLHELGVLDRVVARAGQYPAEYYDEPTLAEVDEIPLLTDKTDTAGHLQISREVVIAQRPDVVLGGVDNLDRQTLASAGIALLEEPAMCDAGLPAVSFDDVYAQMQFYGTVFDRTDEAARAVVDLRERVDAVAATTDGAAGTRTAAVLYPTVGGGVTYAYGTGSMAHPQLEAAGLTNVFGDVEDRVFEVTREELIGRNPDVLVLLYGDGDPQLVEDAVTSLPGASGMTAVREGNILVQLFNFTEPPTPLSVVGLERIVERFGTGTTP